MGKYTSFEDFLIKNDTNLKNFEANIKYSGCFLFDTSNFNIKDYNTLYELSIKLNNGHLIDALYEIDEVITDAFEWEDTPEGDDFWDELDDLWKEFIYGCSTKTQKKFPLLATSTSRIKGIKKLRDNLNKIEIEEVL